VSYKAIPQLQRRQQHRQDDDDNDDRQRGALYSVQGVDRPDNVDAPDLSAT
jgi:hypothetical protein